MKCFICGKIISSNIRYVSVPCEVKVNDFFNTSVISDIEIPICIECYNNRSDAKINNFIGG